MNQTFEREVVFDSCVIFDFKAGRIKEDIFCLTSSLFIQLFITKRSEKNERPLPSMVNPSTKSPSMRKHQGAFP